MPLFFGSMAMEILLGAHEFSCAMMWVLAGLFEVKSRKGERRASFVPKEMFRIALTKILMYGIRFLVWISRESI